MKIACLGWGSLIWNPGQLPTRGRWFNDGPLLPLEFSRESGQESKHNRRITIVITPGVQVVRSLWTLLSVPNLDGAKIALAQREGIETKNLGKDIGIWVAQQDTAREQPSIDPNIEKWARTIGLDAVVWTALPPGLCDARGTTPRPEAVIAFLKNLRGSEASAAEAYVRLAPAQIDTLYRRRIAEEFSWVPIVTS